MNNVIVKAHHAGLFSLLNNYMAWAVERGFENTWADWTQTIYDASSENLWDKLFTPLGAPPKDAEVVGVHPEQKYTYLNAAKLYTNPNPRIWRAQLHSIWQRIIPPQWIYNQALIFVQEAHPEVAVLIRAHGHAGEQITGKSQTIGEYAAALHAAGCDENTPIYVASNSWEPIGQLREQGPFRHLLYYGNSKRGLSRHEDPHLSGNQTWEDAALVLTEVLIMKHCETLVHPVSNMATAALYMNPYLESVYIP